MLASYFTAALAFYSLLFWSFITVHLSKVTKSVLSSAIYVVN